MSVVTLVGGCCAYFFFRVVTAVAKPDGKEPEERAS